MKTSVVPSQITSIEDVIAANLTLIQLLLLVLPVFLSALVFSCLPPDLHIRVYKVIVLLILSPPILVLSIRYKGEVLFRRLLVQLSFRLRPRLYLLSREPKCDCETHMQFKSTDNIDSDELKISYKPEPIDPLKLCAIQDELSKKRVQFMIGAEGRIDAVIESK